MLTASIAKNDKKAYWLIGVFSVIVFVVVTILGKYQLKIDAGFNVHIFAAINAFINGAVAILLLAGLWAVKNRRYTLHRNIMLGAMVLSVFFLLSYIAHHLLAGEARFGDTDGNGIVSAAEAADIGAMRIIYLVLLSTHILLAALILPFILFTAYRGLTSEFDKHKKLSRYTWPLWLYVAVTGPIIYVMISPYY